uniref:Helicase ATP-binding domain-containing protein n=1 Tax=Spongospora subterranea TaxID=70186 RepID=A0A0H5RBZ9_9EUKA|eukprot:CRZ06024.1 hypothetical protein [Spongospora subterranea]
MRQNCRDLQNKLGRATSCRKQDNYGRKTFGIWKSLKGPKSKIRRVYINIAGVEYTGSAAIEAARADTEARINRQFIPKNRDHSPEPFTLDFWSIPQTVQDVYASKGIRSLYSWQVEALSLAGVADGSKNFVFSTPTSSGKSLISEILLIRSLILKKRKAIVILPFISLVEEKCSDLTEKLCSIGYCCKAFHSVIPPVFNNDVDVAICTFEKASIMINLLITSGRMCQIGIVIVDELHYIGDPHRGFILEGIMSKVLTCPFDPESPPQIVGMSATLSNFPALSSWLNAIDYTCDFRPVPLKQHVCHSRCRTFTFHHHL